MNPRLIGLVALSLSCARGGAVSSPLDRARGVEVYGEAGTPAGLAYNLVWGPDALFGRESGDTVLRRSFPRLGPVETLPTPCERWLTLEADPDFGAVVRCGDGEVYTFDADWEGVRLGHAEDIVVGHSALLLDDEAATWVDAQGQLLATRRLPFHKRSEWATEGPLWVAAFDQGDDRQLLWWFNLESQQERYMELGPGRVQGIATDGRRAVVRQGSPAEDVLRWFDLTTGHSLGESAVDADDIGFVGDTLWARTRQGWVRLREPDDPTAPQGGPLPYLQPRFDARGVVAEAGGLLATWAPDGAVTTAPSSPWWGVEDAALSADGRVLAVLGHDGQVSVVDRSTGLQRHWPNGALTGDRTFPSRVSLSPDGRWALSLGYEAVFIDLETGQPLAEQGLNMDYRWAAWTPDGCAEVFSWTCGRRWLSASWFCPDQGPEQVGELSFRTGSGGGGDGHVAISPDGRSVATWARPHAMAVHPIGPNSPPFPSDQRYEADPIDTPLSDLIEPATLRGFAWDAEGALVTLWCDEDTCMREVGDTPATATFTVGTVQLLSTDGQRVLGLVGRRAVFYDAEGQRLSRTPLAGTPTRVVMADAAAAIVLDDGRVQVVDADQGP